MVNQKLDDLTLVNICLLSVVSGISHDSICCLILYVFPVLLKIKSIESYHKALFLSNDNVELNILLISVTLLTSHEPIF